MKLILIFVSLITFKFASGNQSPQIVSEKNDVSCERIKTEACVEFRGRARAYMGRAETRIWKIGSNRLFAVREVSQQARTEMSNVNFHQDLFGVFNVCPTSKYKKGAIQEICVASVTQTNLKATGQ